MEKEKVTKYDLTIGTKIKIGELYSKSHRFKSGEIITLINGTFEEDNGLYCYDVDCPSILNTEDEEMDEFDSIYHLFGNDIENFMDCEIIKS